MSDHQAWLDDEREWRIRCYWSWLSPIVWAFVIGTIMAVVGRQQWMLEAVLVPAWFIAAIHAGYYATVIRQRRPGLPGIALGLAVVAGGVAWAWAGVPAALSCALCAPLLFLYGAAHAPPILPGRTPGWVDTAICLSAALRPCAWMALLACAWVLSTTHAGANLAPTHRVAWWLGGAMAVLLVLVPSMVFRVMTRRLCSAAAVAA